MCGIVLAGNQRMVESDIRLFEQLVDHDTIRGHHSTGIIANPNKKLLTDRSMLTGTDYVYSSEWLKIFKRLLPKAGSVATGSFMVGHNRYATTGRIDKNSAHPFQHGNITLVHNGTLTNHKELPHSSQFAVDSENICYLINELGAAETIQLLDGAFVLVWHDAGNNTLNLIRNKERPFHFIEDASGCYFGASEEAMLMWLYNRRQRARQIKRHFEAEVGTQYVFDVANGNFELIEEIKHTLPVFKRKPLTNMTIAKLYAYADDGQYYTPATWNQKCKTCKRPIPYDIAEQCIYDKQGGFQCPVCFDAETNTNTVTNKKHVNKQPTLVLADDCKYYTEEHWDFRCETCGKKIPFSEAELAASAGNGQFQCGECFDADIEEYMKSDHGIDMYGVCSYCGMYTRVDPLTGCCEDCEEFVKM